MADKTDKVKTILNSHTDKLADIEDKVDELLDITSHLKWLSRDTKTTDNEDEDDLDNLVDLNEDDCTGKENCECQSCREYNDPDLKVERLKNEVKRQKALVQSVWHTEYDTEDDATDDTDSDINDSDLAGEGFTTDDDK